ncbi:hypothetical protein OROHE_014521 [Orobanche hederae]
MKAVFLENGTLVNLSGQHPTRGDIEASSFRCLERRKFGNGLGFVITGEGKAKACSGDQANEEIIKGHRGTEIQKMLSTGNDAEADAIASKGKSHAQNWLVGRRGKKAISASTQAPPIDQFVTELTTKIRNDLEIELEAKVNIKVQENMTSLLKKLGEVNPNLNLDIGEFCATISSDQDDNGTPMTQGGTTS